jgi:iron complex outermembrane receptor protein
MGYTNPSVASSTIPIQNVEIYGVEYQFRWQPLDGTRVMLSQTFARIAADYLPSALVLTSSSLGNASKRADIENFTEHSMPSRSTALLLMQKLPYGLEFSAANYWQEAMKWSTNTSVGKYQRLDARIGYPFRFGAIGGEVALTAQTLDGSHMEYKGDGSHNEGRLVERRQWVSLRLDY